MSVQIRRLWPTVIGECFPEVPTTVIERLKAVGRANEADRLYYGYDSAKGRPRPDITNTDDPELVEYEMILTKNFREFLAQATGDRRAFEWPLELRTFCQIYKKGQRIRPHYHFHADWIAGYYVNGVKPEDITDPEECGRVVFVDPRPNVQHSTDPQCVFVPADTGKMTFFPGYLLHETEMHPGEEERFFVGTDIRVLHHAVKTFHRARG